MKARLKWLDIAKGIGILLVVFGHCMDFNEMPFQLIFVFHMPMFFILSGYVFDEKQDFKEVVIKRFQSLIIPYWLFFLIGAVFTWTIPTWRSGITWNGIRDDFVYAYPNTMHNSSIWFLVCLFWVQIIYWIICKFTNNAQMLACLILYIAGILYNCSEFSIEGLSRLPLCLDVVPIAVLFFGTGHFLKKHQIISFMTNRISNCIIAIVAGALGVLQCHKLNGYVNMHGLTFNDPVLYFMGAMFGTAAVIGISCAFEVLHSKFLLKVSEFFSFFGRNSLLILGLQSLLIRLVILLFSYNGVELYLYQMSMKYTIFCGVAVTAICSIVCMVIENYQMRRKRQ